MLPESRRAVTGWLFTLTAIVGASRGKAAWRAPPASQGLPRHCREAGSGSVGMGSSLSIPLVGRGGGGVFCGLLSQLRLGSGQWQAGPHQNPCGWSLCSPLLMLSKARADSRASTISLGPWRFSYPPLSYFQAAELVESDPLQLSPLLRWWCTFQAGATFWRSGAESPSGQV